MEENRPPTPKEVVKKRSGAPKGNQNARKHGFYSDVLDDVEYQALHEIRGYEDLDGEIDIMRVKIQSVLRHDPNNVRLIIEATNNLAKLMKTRDKLSIKGRNKLRDSINSVFQELAGPFGVDVKSELRKRIRPESLDKMGNRVVSPKK